MEEYSILTVKVDRIKIRTNLNKGKIVSFYSLKNLSVSYISPLQSNT